VLANDIDPHAPAAIRANAKANGVRVRPVLRDLLALPARQLDFDVVLAGDACYTDQLAGRILPFLLAAARRDVLVLVGDPGRGRIPGGDWQVVSTYPVTATAGEDANIRTASVLTPRGAG
jgi:predicted nicotinamide N-methyase